MTTDITELAQRLKLEVHRAVSNFNPQMNIKTRDLKELVEALEKAQQERDNWRTTFDNERFRADKLKAHIDEMTEERNASINELSRIIQKEVKAKRETEQRIAELESRTVTVKLASRRLPSDYVDGEFGNDDLAAIHNACRLECKVSVEKYLSAHGIVVKWEAE